MARARPRRDISRSRVKIRVTPLARPKSSLAGRLGISKESDLDARKTGRVENLARDWFIRRKRPAWDGIFKDDMSFIRLIRQTASASLVVKLEGNLKEEAVELIRQECLPRPGEPQRLRLDLRQLGQVDAAGLRLLKEIKARPGVELMNCSPLLLTLLEGPPE